MLSDYTYDDLKPQSGEPFHAWVKRVRTTKGLHVNDMARKAERDHPWWSRLESGKSSRKDEKPSQVTRETVRKIAYALGVSENMAMMAAGYTPPIMTIKDGEIFEVKASEMIPLPAEEGMRMVAWISNSESRFDALLKRFEAGIEHMERLTASASE